MGIAGVIAWLLESNPRAKLQTFWGERVQGLIHFTFQANWLTFRANSLHGAS